MTAITTRPVQSGTDSRPRPSRERSLLRFALRADATLCAAVGLFVAMAADPLSRLSGLSATSEFIAGAALVGYGVALYAGARVPDVRRLGVGVLVGNVAFAVLVTVVLIAGWLPLTTFGVASTLTFTALTVAFAYAQYLGVRRPA
ncbi:hypothetical protein [Mycobacterium sp. 1274761.0]|uniref:hypothetical protein n=1 Tax=Mycobacterium sp. 1274761.0 TaxID=1834077 RepID=UPI0008003DB9|nr:hypothetical protein [Mycobacterium sp. 1274761.0]OBK79463.1 hypothetical protein A5651_23735 [Mycobacterium sp. 1274761.0]